MSFNLNQLRNRLRSLVLHPFLFALYPVLFLYNINSDEIRFASVYRPAAALLLFAAAALVLLRLLARGWQRAGLLLTLFLVLFFSFGHVDGFLGQSVNPELRPDQNWDLALLWLGLFLAGLVWFGFLLRRPARLNMLFNLAAIFLFLFNGLGVVRGVLNQPGIRPPWNEEGLVTYHPLYNEVPQAGKVTGKPDIYYIILDGYAQGSVLEDIYGLDNSAFYDSLRERGFSLAPGSHANYPQTILSLSSSLNFAYLPDLLSVSRFQQSRAPLIPLLNDSRLTRFLKGQGYRFVALESGYPSTDLSGADLFVPAPAGLNPLEDQVLSSSLARLWSFELQTEAQRRSILARFRTAARLPRLAGPKFVFIHLVMPHPPFIFDRSGGLVLPDDLSLRDGSHYRHPGPVYVSRYTEQLLYANRLVQDLLDAILAQSPEPPVILLQSDHGPGAYLDWNSLPKSCLRERLSILNAYFLPGVEVDIPPNITPVNSFRIVLDAYFGADLGLLEDRSYFATWPLPFDYQDVSDRLDTCAPLD